MSGASLSEPGRVTSVLCRLRAWGRGYGEAMSSMTGCWWGHGIAVFLLTLPVSAVAGCNRRSAIVADSSPGSSAGFDPGGSEACARFQSDWQRAADKPTRLQLADTVQRLAWRSDNAALTQRIAAMGRSADDGDRAWHAAAAVLLQACRQAGWNTVSPTLPITG